MAANGNYNVNLNLVDGEATKKLREINRQLSKAQAPLKAYQRELKRFNDLSGRTAKIEKFNKSLDNMKNRLANVGQGISNLIKPIAAVFGIGSIAGIVALTRSFANWGNEIRNTSALLGVTAQKAIALKQAGNLAGIGDQAQGLKSFQDTQNSISAGQNATGAYSNRILGINPNMDFRQAELQAVRRVNEMFRKHQINAATGRSLLRLSGVDENLFGQDDKRLERSFKIADENAKEMAPYAKAAADWRDKLAEAGGRIDVIKTKLAAALEPVLGPIVQKFIDWSKNNKAVDETLNKIADAAKSVGAFISKIDFSKINAGIQFIIDHWKALLAGFIILKGFSMAATTISVLSDLKNIAQGLGLVTKAAKEAKTAMNLGRAATVAETAVGGGLGTAALVGTGVVAAGAAAAYSGYNFYKTYKHDHSASGMLENRQKMMKYQQGFTTLQQNEKQRQMMDYLINTKHLTPEQASALTAQARQESGFGTKKIGDGGHAMGLFQWHEDRQAAIEKQFGKSLSSMSMNEQVDAALWELKTSEKRAGSEFFNAKNLDQATKAGLDYERPGEYLKNGIHGAEFANRKSMALAALKANNDLGNSNSNAPKQDMHIVIEQHDHRTTAKVIKNTTPYNPNIADIKTKTQSGNKYS